MDTVVPISQVGSFFPRTRHEQRELFNFAFSLIGEGENMQNRSLRLEKPIQFTADVNAEGLATLTESNMDGDLEVGIPSFKYACKP
jgi:hypothetical protein